MNAIPNFRALEGYEYEVLPDQVWTTAEAAFYHRFVAQIANSTTREEIFRGFKQLRTDAAVRQICATQWIDGSFVETKPDPEDVDVVTFCDYDELNALPAETQRFVEECLAGGESTKMQYKTHTFLVPSCSREHEYFPVFESCRAYWRNWFGTTRTGQHKGLIEMALGDPNRAPTISHARVES